MKALTTGKNPPIDLVDLYLCKLYACRPSELDGEDAARLTRHMAVDDMIQKYNRHRQKKY